MQANFHRDLGSSKKNKGEINLEISNEGLARGNRMVIHGDNYKFLDPKYNQAS